MNQSSGCAPDRRRETVSFISNLGMGQVAVRERHVTWDRKVSATTVLLFTGYVVKQNGGLAERVSAHYPGPSPAGPGFTGALDLAVDMATMASRNYNCARKDPRGGIEVVVRAQAWDVPMIEDEDGSLSPVPEGWLPEDRDLLAAWLTGQEPGFEPITISPRPVASSVVWRSRASPDRNDATVEDFRSRVAVLEEPGSTMTM